MELPPCVEEAGDVGYSRIGTLPVASSVLDAPAGGVSPGSPRSSRGEATPVSTSASHPAHGAARAAGPPWTCRESSVSRPGRRPRLQDRAVPLAVLNVTSAQRGRHSSLLTWGHPASHAVHRALLPCEGNFELAPLEILP